MTVSLVYLASFHRAYWAGEMMRAFLERWVGTLASLRGLPGRPEAEGMDLSRELTAGMADDSP